MSSYYAVIFTSQLSNNKEGYSQMAKTMESIAQKQQGYLGIETARDDIGITISYWESLESIKTWKNNLDHLVAQKLGKEQWYSWYKVRICKIEREYFYEQ